MVRRLLRSGFGVQSLLLTPGKLERLRADLRPEVPVYAASVEQMEAIAGFTIHRGAVACGIRRPKLSLDQAVIAAGDGRLVVVLENICDAQNVGAALSLHDTDGAPIWPEPAIVEPIVYEPEVGPLSAVAVAFQSDGSILLDAYRVIARHSHCDSLGSSYSDE